MNTAVLIAVVTWLVGGCEACALTTCTKYVERYRVGDSPLAGLMGGVEMEEDLRDYGKQLGVRGGFIVIVAFLIPLTCGCWRCCRGAPYEWKEATRRK